MITRFLLSGQAQFLKTVSLKKVVLDFILFKVCAALDYMTSVFSCKILDSSIDRDQIA